MDENNALKDYIINDEDQELDRKKEKENISSIKKK